MKDSIFFDTSALVHAYTLDEPKKHAAYSKLVREVFLGKMKGVVSNQVIAELFFVLVNKKKARVEEVEVIVNSFILSDYWRKINYTFSTIEKAKRIAVELDLPFWDSLIIATMLEHGIKKIYTEDEHFEKARGIKVLRPEPTT